MINCTHGRSTLRNAFRRPLPRHCAPNGEGKGLSQLFTHAIRPVFYVSDRRTLCYQRANLASWSQVRHPSGSRIYVGHAIYGRRLSQLDVERLSVSLSDGWAWEGVVQSPLSEASPT